MRLLNTGNYTLKEFLEADAEQYAILSHCWGQGDEFREVDYHELRSVDHDILRSGNYGDYSYGWRKIVDCCRIARERGYHWVWIDTW
jgi:hypothetical protein